MDEEQIPDRAWQEPRITINGVVLTEAQAMAARVAVTSMRFGLHDWKSEPKKLEGLDAAYDANLQAVERIMLAEAEKEKP
jgi:hypothetical protein